MWPLRWGLGGRGMQRPARGLDTVDFEAVVARAPHAVADGAQWCELPGGPPLVRHAVLCPAIGAVAAGPVPTIRAWPEEEAGAFETRVEIGVSWFLVQAVQKGVDGGVREGIGSQVNAVCRRSGRGSWGCARHRGGAELGEMGGVAGARKTVAYLPDLSLRDS